MNAAPSSTVVSLPACVLLSLWLGGAAIGGEAWTLDFSQTNGVIRPLHGVNLGPLCYRGMVDLTEYHRALDLPLTRLHDVVWVNYDAVDVSTVFRDFRDDPFRADNYSFAATDDYVEAVVRAGSPVLYRLGESIEHTARKYRVHPPADYQKWAEVCCRIIAHYNEGWAGGFRYGIRYWEIWNEPENQPAMWTGTDEAYWDLYEVTAKAIKARWPDLKVGGPSLGHTGHFEGERFVPSAFLLGFLGRCRDREVPLDFFSWHRYAAEPSEYGRRARALRGVLDAHGFGATESHCNEWNYLPGEDWRPMTREGQGRIRETWAKEIRGPRGAAFAAWTLMALQDAPVDMANFYTAEVQMFGMFNIHGVPQKTYYAFKAFRELLETARRVRTPECVAGRIALCAGLSEGNDRAAVLFSNFDASDGGLGALTLRGMPWQVPTRFEVWVVDAANDFELLRSGVVQEGNELGLPELKAPSVVFVRLSAVTDSHSEL